MLKFENLKLADNGKSDELKTLLGTIWCMLGNSNERKEKSTQSNLVNMPFSGGKLKMSY